MPSKEIVHEISRQMPWEEFSLLQKKKVSDKNEAGCGTKNKRKLSRKLLEAKMNKRTTIIRQRSFLSSVWLALNSPQNGIKQGLLYLLKQNICLMKLFWF